MAGTEQGDSGWESSVRAALRDLTLKDMPSFEILFLDDLAGWAFSVSNPGHSYNETHGTLVVATLLGAIERAGSFRPAQAPAESGTIPATREKIAAGAHEFAETSKGLAQLIGLLAPSAVRELERSAGQPAAQTYWLFHYALLVLSSGKGGDVSEDTLRGITAIFQAWGELAAAGFVLPWRTRQSMESQASADMVASHVETLIERLTGAEKAKVDPDGDYPISYRNALFFARVVPAWKPVVQIFSVAVDGIEFTDALARDLNEINARLHFCRTFWVRGQVLVEAEHLGPSLTEADFDECALHVAKATDRFAKGLAERHGGRLAFEESKGAEYAPPAADERLGYL
jgi:T3SS (YopN, CesT) and YbjN peptide-binding chaperone 1